MVLETFIIKRVPAIISIHISNSYTAGPSPVISICLVAPCQIKLLLLGRYIFQNKTKTLNGICNFFFLPVVWIFNNCVHVCSILHSASRPETCRILSMTDCTSRRLHMPYITFLMKADDLRKCIHPQTSCKMLKWGICLIVLSLVMRKGKMVSWSVFNALCWLQGAT